jgi:Tfp pilus assembly protein PilF
VISTRGGEELQLRKEADWRSVVATQNLVGGDTLRTNSAGAVAVLFEDRTQVRVGRNSTLIVKEVATASGGETRLSLPEGSIFARAARGGTGVTVETPAAAAAIRGTDWSLAVDGPKTSLVVLEGVVTLANPQGSVTVAQGEGAEALIGQAPRKITLVDLKGRQQLLIQRELRDTFFDLSPSDLSRTGERSARTRALSVPEQRRSARDWLTLAETGLYFDGPAASARALAEAERRPLSGAERARAQLTRGFLLARTQKWAEAAAAFRAAERGLDRERAATAAYGAWVSEALANPARRPPPPPVGKVAGSARGALAQASVESFTDNARRGVDLLNEAEKRYPDDVLIAVGKAALLLMANDDEGAKAAIERARSIDPDDPFMLAMSARYRWTVQGDLKLARDELRRAIATAPGNSALYGELALVQAELGALHEAEAAHRKEIEFDPDGPLGYANYANFLVDQNQLAAADEQLRKAEALDPNGYYQLISRGRLLLRQGHVEEGRAKLLAGSAIQPANADGLIALAIANYKAGAFEETAQALDNADRFDDDNPNTPLIQSQIAVDEYRADDAIAAAREAARRQEAKGGDYALISSNREDGSYIGNALRFLELDEWARYYGDKFFDPFDSTGYFDQAIIDRPSLFSRSASTLDPAEAGTLGSGAGSLLVQGLLLNPMAVAGPERRTDFTGGPFSEAAAEAGFSSEKGREGWLADGTLQGRTLSPTPFAYYLNATVTRPGNRFDDADDKLAQGAAFLTAQPTAYDSLVLFGAYARNKGGARYLNEPGQQSFFDIRSGLQTARAANVGAGWSHVFAERNVVQALLVASTSKQTSYFDGGFLGVVPFSQADATRQRQVNGGVNHLFGFGDVDFQYGGEVLATSIKQRRVTNDFGFGPSTVSVSPDGRAERLYADATWKPTDSFKAEGGLFASSARISSDGAKVDHQRLDPRIGAAFEPFQNHWLRAAYRRDSQFDTRFSLSPSTTVGLSPNETPLNFGGRANTAAIRWDAEWSQRLFTALEFQSQNLKGLQISVVESPFDLGARKGQADRLSLSTNLWLGHGLGLFGSYARTWSSIDRGIDLTDVTGLPVFDPRSGAPARLRAGSRIPYVPKDQARLGFSYVSSAMVKITLAENYVGETLNEVGGELGSFFTTDFSATWEPFDKRLELAFQALNIFDKRFENASGVLGQGRTLIATARVRL